jgi:hypothetical protein
MVCSDIGNVVWGAEEEVDVEVVVVVISCRLLDVVVVLVEFVMGRLEGVVVLEEEVVVDTSLVVVDTAGLVVNASSGTISQPASSMFQANIRHDDPPFSYINKLSGTLAASRVRFPDIVQVQPWSYQTPNVLPPIVISPPSSEANMNSIDSCTGIAMKPDKCTMNRSSGQPSTGSPS